MPSSTPTFRVRTISRRGQMAMAIDGEFDVLAAQMICKRVSALREEGCRDVVLDLGAATRFDRDALGWLVEAYEDQRNARGRLSIVEAPTGVAQLLHALGLQFMLG